MTDSGQPYLYDEVKHELFGDINEYRNLSRDEKEILNEQYSRISLGLDPVTGKQKENRTIQSFII